MGLEDIRIVLIETAHPGNIGAVARAMKTMSLARLVLVRPNVFPSAEADRRAMGSIDLLQRAEVVDDLAEAVGDCPLVVGCSARPRSFPHPEVDARECGALLVEEARAEAPAAVVFGPERMGLANHDLDRCTHQVLIPASESFSSLNLAAAAQIVCYEVFLAAIAQNEVRSKVEVGSRLDPPAHHEDSEYLFKHLEGALDSRGYLEGQMREVTMMKLRRVISRARPSLGELKLLHSLARLIERDDA